MTVKELRNKTGLNQRLFAQKFHITLCTLQSWEQGRRNAPDYVMFMMEHILDLESRNNESTLKNI